ncbi:MAG: LPS export ABC transporter permease LptF [bacterium]|nr:LPS export ABC transporter permease LptF [bacterium]
MKLRICTRYILKQLTWSTIFITLALTLAVWLTQSLRFVDLVLNKGFPLSTFFYLVIFLVPDLIGVILPIGFFIACLFICHKLLLDSEITVMRASGFSQGQILRAPLILSIFVALFLYILNLYVMPFSFRQFKDMEYQIRQQSSALLLQPGRFNATKGMTFYTQKVLSDGSLEGLLIHDQRSKESPVTLTAQRGLLDMSSDAPRLRLFEGSHQQLDANTKSIRTIYFDQYTLKLPPPAPVQARKHRKLYEEYLETLIFPEEENLQKRLQMQAEGFKRLLSPLLAFGFSLLAFLFLLGGQLQRRGHAKRLGASVVIAIGLQMAFLGFINATDKNLWPIWGAVLVIVLAILVPLKFLIFPTFFKRGHSK